jgi:diguanylate cyclase (GGDEF)-like protein
MPIDIKKCRSILGKDDRQLLYSSKIINDHFIHRPDFKEISTFKFKDEENFYYCLNFGSKKDQFHFTIFSSSVDISMEILNALSNFIKGHFGIIQKFDDLYKTNELIHIDDVTGLYNQRKLFKDLGHLVDKFQTDKDPFCVLFIDLDYFKKINDKYGHLVGTKLLESVAQEIKSLLRDSDISYRYGGDEFVVILVNSDGNSGKIVGERILQTIKDHNFEITILDEKVIIKLSVSIGVAEFPNDAVSSEEVLIIADRMMFEAKESGRGIVFNTQDIFKSSLKKAIDFKKIENGKT